MWIWWFILGSSCELGDIFAFWELFMNLVISMDLYVNVVIYFRIFGSLCECGDLFWDFWISMWMRWFILFFLWIGDIFGFFCELGELWISMWMWEFILGFLDLYVNVGIYFEIFGSLCECCDLFKLNKTKDLKLYRIVILFTINFNYHYLILQTPYLYTLKFKLFKTLIIITKLPPAGASRKLDGSPAIC